MDTARIRIWRSALLISLASLGALPACSASKGSSIADGAGGGDGGADGATTDASTKADGSTTTDPTTKDASAAETSTGECSGEATQTACVSCCSKAHQDGASAYLVATIDCMCLPANCEKDCAATLCNAANPKAPDATCTTCVNGKNGACAQSIKSACTADPDCVAFDACVGESSCATK